MASLNQSSQVTVQAKFQQAFNRSPLTLFQAQMAGTIQRKCRECAAEEDLQAGLGISQRKTGTVQKQAAPANRTGLPDDLKTGMESLSGLSLDDVNVHYNSDKPAQLQALAYTQGTDIHVAPGEEKNLAHEAWHVVQQKQGRVAPTTQLQGVAVNDDTGLEREADAMGAQASRYQGPVQRMKSPRAGLIGAPIVQRYENAEAVTDITDNVLPDLQLRANEIPAGIEGETLQIIKELLSAIRQAINRANEPQQEELEGGTAQTGRETLNRLEDLWIHVSLTLLDRTLDMPVTDEENELLPTVTEQRQEYGFEAAREWLELYQQGADESRNIRLTLPTIEESFERWIQGGEAKAGAEAAQNQGWQQGFDQGESVNAAYRQGVADRRAGKMALPPIPNQVQVPHNLPVLDDQEDVSQAYRNGFNQKVRDNFHVGYKLDFGH
ncbi:MAG: DUF4157 domain-containing protein [Blastocatellia bacterium]|nr:DUF4157 domain-containing protein [Blastocatellia bacterium]